ncbi:MAG TPA: hypothetical protein VMT52_07365 [Planctomycetota bacterium]|nr:hypothetical protein [Planctomycetota bacterium]
MIHRIGEEWERIGESFRQREATEPVEIEKVLGAVEGVRDALRVMCQVSVTRTTLRSAIQDALVPILREHGPALFPDLFREVAGLRDQVTSFAGASEALECRDLGTAGDPVVGAAMPAEVAMKLEGFEERIQRLIEQGDEAQVSFADCREKIAGVDGKVEEVDERLEGVDARLDAFDSRLGELDARLGVRIAGVDDRLETVEGRLGEVQEGVGEVNFRVAESDGCRARTDVALTELSRDLREGLGEELRGGLDGLEGKVTALEKRHAESEASLRAAFEMELRRGIEGVQSGIDGLSDELLGLLAKLEDSIPSVVASGTGEVETRLRAEMATSAARLTATVSGLRDNLQAFSMELEERQEASLTALRGGLETRLGDGLRDAEKSLGMVRSRLEAWLSRLEESFPAALDERARDVEEALRKEIDAMVTDLSAKLSDLGGVLRRMEGLLPRKDAFDSLDERLLRLEDGLLKVASHVESVDALTPDMRTMGERVAALRDQLSALSGDVGEAGGRVAELKGFFSGGLGELKGLLDAGIQRWESDQSQTLERLSAIRDSLRDQLRAVGDRVAAAQGGLLRRLSGKADGGVKLTKDDWDRVSTKLEGIISGLESVLARKQGH